MTRVLAILEEMRDLSKKNAQKAAAARSRRPRISSRQAKPAGQRPALAASLKDVSADDLRRYGDAVRDEAEPLVAFLASVQEDGKLPMVCAVSQNLVAKNWHAKDLFGQFAKVVGGGGGGSPTLASGGGKDASKLPEAIALFEKLVAEKAK